jgi:hypothetical protein
MQKRGDEVVQVVEHLPSKLEALSTTKKRKKRKREKEKEREKVF